MLNCRINTKKIWYADNTGDAPVYNEDGDYTGEKKLTYGVPKMIRANISPARGGVAYDIFGANLKYSRTLSTTDMGLPINERTLIWVSEPGLLQDGTADPETADYRIAGIARGHYHVHYALKQINKEDED